MKSNVPNPLQDAISSIFQSSSNGALGLYQNALREYLFSLRLGTSKSPRYLKARKDLVEKSQIVVSLLSKLYDTAQSRIPVANAIISGPVGSTSLYKLWLKESHLEPLLSLGPDPIRGKVLDWLLGEASAPSLNQFCNALLLDTGAIEGISPYDMAIILGNYCSLHLSKDVVSSTIVSITHCPLVSKDVLWHLQSLYPLRTFGSRKNKATMSFSNWSFSKPNEPSSSISSKSFTPSKLIRFFSPLTESSFSLLPKKSREWLLYYSRTSGLFLESEFYTKFHTYFLYPTKSTNPLVSPKNPLSSISFMPRVRKILIDDKREILLGIKKRLPQVLKKIKDRDFSDNAVQEFLENPYASYFSTQIEKAFKTRKSSLKYCEETLGISSLKLKDFSEETWGKSNAFFIEFFSIDRAKRLNFLLKSKIKSSFFIACLPRLDFLNALGEGVESLVGKNKEKLLSRLWSIPRFKDIMIEELLVNKSSGNRLSFVEIWHPSLWRRLTHEQILLVFQSYSNLLESISAQEFIKGSVQSKLLSKLPSSILTEFIDYPLSTSIQSLSSIPISILRKFLTFLFSTSLLESEALEKLGNALSSNPQLLSSLSTAKVPLLVYQAILKNLGWKSSLSLTLKNNEGIPYFLNEKVFSETDYESILGNLKRYNPRCLEKFKNLYLENLWNDLETKKKLNEYLDGKLRFSSLGLSQNLLKMLLPKIFQENKSKPLLASAYTLAILFSPWDIKFFRSVAIKLINRRKGVREEDKAGNLLSNLYRLKPIPKKSGGVRNLHIPCDNLKRIQRNLLVYGFSRYPLPSYVHGFKRSSSILTNALPHVQKPFVVNIDIDSFFDTCKYPRIKSACYKILKDNPYAPMGAEVLAEICTYENSLPTGSPTSPVIANMILERADKVLDKACARWGITYTRYGDDLTFSGKENTLKIIPFAAKVLGALGFKLKARKTNVYRSGRRQMVTGLTVNSQVSVPRSIRRKLRAAVHSWKTTGNAHWGLKSLELNGLKGKIAFVGLTHKELAKKWRQSL